MKRSIPAVLASAALLLSWSASAQDRSSSHDAHHAAPAAAAPAAPAAPAPDSAQAVDMTEGEVRRVDVDAGKLTLRHGEIRNLDMPPMTMVFSVRDRAVLDGLKPGDRVRFRVEAEGGGYVVTELQAVR